MKRRPPLRIKPFLPNSAARKAYEVWCEGLEKLMAAWNLEGERVKEQNKSNGQIWHKKQ